MVLTSADIQTPAEAVAYYAEKLAGGRNVTCYTKRIRIVFERDATHLFSDGPDDRLSPDEKIAWYEAIPEHLRIKRKLPNGRVEVRKFSLERARLLDSVLPSISNFMVSVPGTGSRGHTNRMLHGAALQDGRHMRVVLRPGPGEAFTCVTAYPISRDIYLSMVKAKRAKFPPD